MKRSRAVLLGWSGVILLVVPACRWTTLKAFSEDDAAAVAACNPPASAATRQGFLAWASQLVYMRDQDRGRLHGFQAPPNGAARLEITSPNRSIGHVRQGCVIGRIVSNYADQSFGFIAGTTYIWADSSSPNSVHLVPDDGTGDMIGYNMAVMPIPDDPGDPVAPSGTPAKHVCSECTKSDWCVYPRDSFRVVEQAPPSVLSP